MSGGYQVRLRLHSGIPVVDVRGAWDSRVAEALDEMIHALLNAGHYEIVVNIQRATLEGLSVLCSLAQLAKAIRAHYGHINIVGNVEQIEELLRHKSDKLFRLAISEASAIGRIKRIPIWTSGPSSPARPQGAVRPEKHGRTD
jgi:anti-anti-sigma regulatory factor